jgi:predicted DNA-binding transcriptional regulator AlpA
MKFLRLIDIAKLLGVSKQRAYQLSRVRGFPFPAGQYERGRLWRKSDIKTWARDSYDGGSKRWGNRTKLKESG